jgi:hypothetical protein
MSARVLYITVALFTGCLACATHRALDLCATPEKPCTRAAPHPQPVIAIATACDGVAAEVMDLPPGSTVTVLPAPDIDLPMPDDREGFFAAVAGLPPAIAIASYDSLDRDMFWARLQFSSLAVVQRNHPDLDPELVRAAKIHACELALAGGAS